MKKALFAAALLLSPAVAAAQSAGTVALPTGNGVNTPASLSAAINAALTPKLDVTRLGAASGVAPLDANAHVPAVNLNFGTSAGTVADGGALNTANTNITANAAAISVLNSSIGAASGIAKLDGNSLLLTAELPAPVTAADALANTAVQPAALSGYAPLASIGAASGIAKLDASSLLLTAELPASVTSADALAATAVQPAALSGYAPLVSGKVPANDIPVTGSSTSAISAAESLFPEPVITGGFRYMLPTADTSIYDYSAGGTPGAAVSLGSFTGTVANGQISGCLTCGPITLPKFPATLQTISVVFDNGVEPSVLGTNPQNYYPSILGYLPNGTGGATNAGTAVGFTDGFYGLGSVPQGFGVKWINLYQDNRGTSRNFIKSIDNGIHVATLTRVAGQSTGIQLTVDGVVPQPVQGTGAPNTVPTAGEVLQLLGADGRCPSTTSNCWFGGNILYADGTPTLYTAAQIAQEQAAALQWVKINKGLTFSPQIDATTYQIGSYNTGESVNNGHGLTSPNIQNWGYYSTQFLNAGEQTATTFSGYIVPQAVTAQTPPFPTGTNGLLTVTAMTSGTIYDGEVLTVPGGTTETVLGYLTSSGTTAGQAGGYYVNNSQTIGSAGSPITITGVAGPTFGNIQGGGDNATGPVSVEDMNTALNSVGVNWGLNFLGYYTHGNTDGSADGTNGLGGAYWGAPFGTDATTQTLQDITQFYRSVINHTSNDKWIPVLYTEISNSNVPSSAAHIQVRNPLIRRASQVLGYLLVDEVTDSRLAVSLGGSNDTTRNCTPDTGFTDPQAVGGVDFTFQQLDHLHPTVCGQMIQGHMDAAVKAYYLNAPYIPETISSASFIEGMLDYGNPIILNGTVAQTVILPSCEGFVSGVVKFPIKNIGTSGTNATIQSASGYNGGAAATIDGSATYSLPSDNRERYFTTTFNGDIAGGCNWTVQ